MIMYRTLEEIKSFSVSFEQKKVKLVIKNKLLVLIEIDFDDVKVD